MQGHTSLNGPQASEGADAQRGESVPPIGNVVAFPGHRRPADAELRRVLDVLVYAGPMSVRLLRMEVGMPEDLLITCVERLAGVWLLTAEDRKDGNALRLIVSATDAGRRWLADGAVDTEVSGESYGYGGGD